MAAVLTRSLHAVRFVRLATRARSNLQSSSPPSDKLPARSRPLSQSIGVCFVSLSCSVTSLSLLFLDRSRFVTDSVTICDSGKTALAHPVAVNEPRSAPRPTELLGLPTYAGIAPVPRRSA